MKIATLSGAVPLTKSFALEDGVITKTPYPHLANFTSTTHEVSTIKELYVVIQAAANAGHCLIKGELSRDLVNESRAGSTNSMAATQWVCLDLDDTSFKTPEEVMKALGLNDISYIVQYSASYGITTKTMGCHIFFLLSAPIKANLLKLWLQHLNLSIPALRKDIQLTKSGASLHWPLDITCCQNDKLLYIALANLSKDIKPNPKNPGIKLVEKSNPTLNISRIGYEPSDNLKKQALTLRNELRISSGLPVIKHKIQNKNGIEIQPGLTSIAVTGGPLYARGHVYFNFNNGDSWAYYHPENNFELIHNFKGEPAYLTKEIMPDYYAECVEARASTTLHTEEGDMPFVFRDLYTATFWNGWWNPKANRHEIYPARTEKQLEHFMLSNNRDMGDFVHTYELIFDPTSDLRLDLEKKIVNNWQPSPLYDRKPIPLSQCGPETWPTIDYIYRHAIGNEEGLQIHWRNWLAFIIQFREKTMTSWLLSGTQGTGKGFITNKIIKPMIGEKHVVMRHQRELNSQFNSYLRTAVVAVIDELDITKMDDAAVIDSDLKNFITEPYISIRAMHQESVPVKNYTNFIFYSNKYQAMSLPANDRRFNIGERQEVALPYSEQLKDQVEAELFHHFSYLVQIQVNEVAARTPYKNKAREELMMLTKTTSDALSDALSNGDFQYILDQLPDQGLMDTPSIQGIKACAYHALIKSILESLTDPKKKGYYRISRDDLFTIFDYCIGGISPSPTRFSQYLNHHGFKLSKSRFGNVLRPGVELPSNLLHTQATVLLEEYFPSKKSAGEQRVESLDKARIKRKLKETAEKALKAQEKRKES